MAKAGDIIAHPVTGEEIVFLKTADDTGGELLQVRMHIAPRGFIPGEHIHPYQAEHFTIRSGTIGFRIDGQETQVAAGQEVTVPAGTPHRWWNAGDEPGELIIEFRPALKIAEFFESFWGLAREGKADPKTGLPNLLWLAVLLGAFRKEIRPTQPPLPAQLVVFGLLAPIARLLGFRLPYPYPHARRRMSQLWQS